MRDYVAAGGLETAGGGATSISGMIGSAPTRLRALALLLSLGLGLAGQTIAGMAMAAPMDMRMGTQASAAHSCPACSDGSAGAMPAQCMTVLCWNLAAIPASGPPLPPAMRTDFAAATCLMAPGLSPGPDPHPPRALFSV